MSVPDKENFTALILVSGIDRPGITSSVINKLAEFSIDILDIKQIVVGERLLQTILIKLLPDHAEAIEQDLEDLAKAIDADIAIDFDQKNQVLQPKKTAFFMMVEDHLDPKRLAHLTNFIQQSGGNILNMQVEKIAALTGLTFQAEFVDLDLNLIKTQTKKMALINKLDIYFDTMLLNNGDRKLFVFDMDSTLIGQEVIDQLAEIAGVSDQVKALTQEAMSGRLDFVQSLTKRVGLLDGLTESSLSKVAQSITFNPGVLETIEMIKKAGHKVAVVSGGFIEVIKSPLEKLSVDYIFANNLEIEDGKLTGKLIGEIMDAKGKASALKSAALDSAIPLNNAVVVGDGANDLEMMAIAGHSFAYNAKDIVKEKAETTISHPDMRAVLLFSGVK
jgi:phosphoserine phosphatase